MTNEIKTYNGTGADCSGSSGDLNRVLTLTNTGLTSQSGFLIYASGLPLALDIEYTIIHNTTGTEITFLNRLWDDMTLIASYSQQTTITTVYETMRDDVQTIIKENGQELTMIRQETTEGTMGEVTVVSEENYNIWTFIQDITAKDRKIHEMGLAIEGNKKAFFYHEYSDAITGNGIISVEAGDIILDTNSKRWRVEQIISEHKGNNQEIFRTGILKNIDLSN